MVILINFVSEEIKLTIDTALWENVATGDQQAYADLFRILYKRFYNYGKKFTGDESVIEDAAQETLLLIWHKRTTLSSVEYPLTYFFTSFRNIIFSRLKANQRYTNQTTLNEEPEFAADHILLCKESDAITRQKLQKAIATLTSRQREAIFLRFYEGLPYREVAQMLGITTKATYKIIGRALDELKTQLNIPGPLLLYLLTGLWGK